MDKESRERYSLDMRRENPYSFINQVIFFEADDDVAFYEDRGHIISFIDIFSDQLDIKIIEEESEEELYGTRAKFFYKS